MIQELKLEIAAAPRQMASRPERRARLIDQLELQLEELEASATEDELIAEEAAAKAGTGALRAATLYANRSPIICRAERVVVEAPTACTCCGSDRIVKMGEDITETLEGPPVLPQTVPRRPSCADQRELPHQWKVIQTVREKFTCRSCEKISQPPALFHAIPRGWAGPSLIAMLVFEKYGQHQPLNRQAERFVVKASS